MFEIDNFKIYKKNVEFVNIRYETVVIDDYILKIGDTLYPTTFVSKDLKNIDFNTYDLIISTSSLSTLIAFLIKFCEKEDDSSTKQTLLDYIYSYFFDIFKCFVRDFTHKMEYDITELKKL